MAVPTLSKEAEDQIISALRTVVADVDDHGTDPSAAVEKVARLHQWGREKIKFASYAYNTGRQTAQRETTKSALDKLAEFPLADPDRVISAIWPEHVDTPAEKAAATAMSAEYAQPPRFLDEREHRLKVAALHAGTEKQADDSCSVCHRPVGMCVCPKKTASTAIAGRHQAKQAFESARGHASACYDRLVQSIDKLAAYFARSPYDRLPFDHVDLAAQAKYGSAGEQLLGLMHQRLPRSAITQQPKEARYDARIKMAQLFEVPPTSEPMRLIDACMKQAASLNDARAAEQTAKQAVDVAEEALRPFVNPPPAPSAGRWSLLEQPSGEPKLAGFGTWMSASAVGSGTKSLLDASLGQSPSKDERVVDQWMDLEDPAHDAQLRQIRARANLVDMLNDDELAGHDPEDVLKAYNRISQMAPRVASQPLAMTTLLRRHMQGQFEPFEAREVSDLETSLKNQENPAAHPYTVLGTGNVPKQPAA